MILETIGHASLLIRNADGTPLLLTDPWLTGSCYWRSWWLQNYPNAEQIEEFRRAPYCFITHEHPDHFHPPSIRLLGDKPTYLAPEFPEQQIGPHLRTAGFKSKVVPACQWFALSSAVEILSLPAANDDSILLIRTPGAYIVNLNDCKPSRRTLEHISEHMRKHGAGRRRIVLSSYSPASIVNSFFRGGTRVSLRQKSDYVNYVSRVCDTLGADHFLPFASQAVFLRQDSAWANDFKVRFTDLQNGWTARAQLLPPYSRIDLDAPHGQPVLLSTIPEADFHQPKDLIAGKIREQEQRDDTATLTPDHIKSLERKLRASFPLTFLLFPKGIGFRCGQTQWHYNPWTRRLRTGKRTGNVLITVAPGILADVIETGRFGDLGITMSMRVDLFPPTDPRLVYGFLFFVTLHDYGHTTSIRAFGRWLRVALKSRRLEIPAPAL